MRRGAGSRTDRRLGLHPWASHQGLLKCLHPPSCLFFFSSLLFFFHFSPFSPTSPLLPHFSPFPLSPLFLRLISHPLLVPLLFRRCCCLRFTYLLACFPRFRPERQVSAAPLRRARPLREFRFPAARAARTASRNRRCRERPRGGATRGGSHDPGGHPGGNPGPAVTQGQECAGTSSRPAGKIRPRWETPPEHLDADAVTPGRGDSGARPGGHRHRLYPLHPRQPQNQPANNKKTRAHVRF